MLGLTQGQVSSQLGITQSQYSRLEKSESDPTKYLVRLSQIFGCDPNELFGKTILREAEEDFLNVNEQHGIGMIHHQETQERSLLTCMVGTTLKVLKIF